MLELREYQSRAVKGLRDRIRTGLRRVVLSAPTGSGKCLAPGTLVITYQGDFVPVEGVVPGMQLMGPDSRPRTILSVSDGHGEMAEIRPRKGPAWRCNLDHVLTLVRTDGAGEIIDVPLKNWMQWSKAKKHAFKLFRTGYELPPERQSIDPYFLGLLIGDGSILQVPQIATIEPEIVEECARQANALGLCLQEYHDKRGPVKSYLFTQGYAGGFENPLTHRLRKIGLWGRRSGDKFIPVEYMSGSRAQRLELLAGLMDTDGSLSKGCHYDYLSKSQELATDIVRLARSVGLAARMSAKEIVQGVYWRVHVSGDVSMIPCRVARKKAGPRRQKKNPMRTGFQVKRIGPGPFHGFTLDGDGRFLLGDCTVTHNTEIAIHMIQSAVAKGKRAVFLCDRIALVEQTAARFHANGITCGVAQGARTMGRSQPIQVCSAQTLERRGYWPESDLVIVDECHTLRKATIEYLQDYPGIAIGLTATPFTEGMGEIYQSVVSVTTTNALIKEGWLSPLKIYDGAQPNMKGAKTVAGEWAAGEVERRGKVIIGDIVTNWVDKTRQEFKSPVKTLVFSATVAHGEDLCHDFQAAGYDFRQISYRQKDQPERAKNIRDFREGRCIGLVSCEALAKGFDVPDVLCLVDARPYKKSLAAHIQKIGRVMRASDGKEFALLLDHAGNWLGFRDDTLDFFGRGATSLLGARRYKEARRAEVRKGELSCLKCGFVLPPESTECPSCGKTRGRPDTGVSFKPGRLTQTGYVNGNDDGAVAGLADPWPHVYTWAMGKYPASKVHLARKRALAAYHELVGRWPRRNDFRTVDRPDPEVVRLLELNTAKYIRRQQRKKLKMAAGG